MSDIALNSEQMRDIQSIKRCFYSALSMDGSILKDILRPDCPGPTSHNLAILCTRNFSEIMFFSEIKFFLSCPSGANTQDVARAQVPALEQRMELILDREQGRLM
eukprot:GHVR01027449.1.p1 GENE.GHVR01027449.1~~GHVR01027449.1.p1  ORF type:complete len:105 (-),score=4.45 GHVR01027449.1:182-496(-)